MLMKNSIFLMLICLDYTAILFLMGFCGLIMNSRNILLMLLSLELTFLASSLNFIMLGSLLNNLLGPGYGMLVILIVVSDTALGLSLMVLGYSGFKSATVNSLCVI